MNTSVAASARLATLNKFQSRLAVSESTGFAGKINQLGINMVDLMMWLVIAALLLAAALQGIGFYQRAAWNYQLQSDAQAVRTYMEAQYTLNSNAYPTFAAAPADLVMTNAGTPNVNTAKTNAAPATGGWSATVCSPSLKTAGAATAGLTITSTSTGFTTANVAPAGC